MRRFTLLLLVIGGVTLALAFGYFATENSYAQGNDPASEQQPPEYVGVRQCFACHREIGQAHLQSSRHAIALQDTSKDKDIILGDFDQGDDVRTVQFPGEDSPRPFTADDISFAIGSGLYVQRYLYTVSGEGETPEYMVLPAEWNVADQTWQPYTPDDETWPSAAYDWTLNCAGCHVTGMDVEARTWNEAGVQCEACHGPGSNHVATVKEVGRSPDQEGLDKILSSIVISPDAQICGQCHSQGQAAGENLPYPTNYLPGQNLLADDVFQLVPPDDSAHWWATDHAKQPNMQFNEWVNSGHPQSLRVLKANSAAEPACLECHSADYNFAAAQLEIRAAAEGESSDITNPVTVESAQFGVTCESCHTIHMQTAIDTENTETSAGGDFLLAKEPYQMCVDCHRSSSSTPGVHHPVQEMFEGLTVVDQVPGVPSAHFAEDGGPICTTCHMPRLSVEDMGTRASHAFMPVLPGAALDVEGLQDTCSSCHSEQVDVQGLQSLIDDIQADTQRRLDEAQAAVTDETPDWVTTALDFVEGDGSLGIHNYVYADELLDAVEAELGLVTQPEATAAAGQ